MRQIFSDTFVNFHLTQTHLPSNISHDPMSYLCSCEVGHDTPMYLHLVQPSFIKF